MMARSMTRSKSKAGYIDARPHIRQLEEVLLQRTAGRPDLTCGSIAPFREHVGMSARDEHMFSGMPPIADVSEPCRHFRVMVWHWNCIRRACGFRGYRRDGEVSPCMIMVNHSILAPLRRGALFWGTREKVPTEPGTLRWRVRPATTAGPITHDPRFRRSRRSRG